MKKYLIKRQSNHHSAENIKTDDESQTIKTNLGIINLNDCQLGQKKIKPKFKNNPNKVFIKRRR